MLCLIPNIFGLRSTTIASDELLSHFDETRSHTPPPSYKEAIQRHPITRRFTTTTSTRPKFIPRSPRYHTNFTHAVGSCTTTAPQPRPNSRRVEYNSYMAAIAYPPKLDPIMRLSSRQKQRKRRSTDSSLTCSSVRGTSGHGARGSGSGSGSGSVTASTFN